MTTFDLQTIHDYAERANAMGDGHQYALGEIVAMCRAALAAPAPQPEPEPERHCMNCAEHGECRPNNLRGCGYETPAPQPVAENHTGVVALLKEIVFEGLRHDGRLIPSEALRSKLVRAKAIIEAVPDFSLPSVGGPIVKYVCARTGADRNSPDRCDGISAVMIGGDLYRLQSDTERECYMRQCCGQCPAAPPRPTSAMIRRLQSAIEGECDGLAVSEGTAEALLVFALQQVPAPQPVAWLYQHKTDTAKRACVVQRMDPSIDGAADWHEIPLGPIERAHGITAAPMQAPKCTRPNVACAWPECGADCRHAAQKDPA